MMRGLSLHFVSKLIFGVQSLTVMGLPKSSVMGHRIKTNSRSKGGNSMQANAELAHLKRCLRVKEDFNSQWTGVATDS